MRYADRRNRETIDRRIEPVVGLGRPGRGGRRRTVFAAAAALLFATGCEVTNPGPVQDEFLNDAASHQGMVDGAALQIARGIKNLAYDGAVLSREVFPTGQIGAHGHDVVVQGGHVPDGSFGGRWNWGQRARFIAEDALRRFIEEEAIPSSEHGTSRLIADAHMWAGFAYRLLGEHWCDAVIDGGPLEPGRRFFEEGEEAFTNAIRVAEAGGHSETRFAALAGRAQVRMWLEDWGGAASDAQEVPDGFVHAAFMDGDPEGARNRMFFAAADTPYRTLTAFNSWQYDYYLETGDPRVPATEVEGADFSTGALSGFGQVPFRRQLKYPTGDTDIPLAKGTEMRLIEAEALLNQGSWQAAMDLINFVRTQFVSDLDGSPLEPWSAGSLDEAWMYLKRERFIDLWLEGRRFGDLRRWDDTSTPGLADWPAFEELTPLFTQEPRSRCLTVSTGERNANVNIDASVEFTGLPHYADPGTRPGGG